ncbi:YceI family protein [Rufibacter sp. LB8]|uniref:YceI family protein n=1 Tax=Rufibacter sp. LB8 TaxID=2777781 RepID=UPI00178C2FE6|nr:YceI family protein [Rufibacter sp. LB8]
MKANRFFCSAVAPVWSMLVVLFMLLLTGGLAAQTTYRLSPGNPGTLKVVGTSDLQDWSMTSGEAVSQGEFLFTPNHQLSGVAGFSFSLKAASLKGPVKAMNRKAHKALNAKKHPYILFTLHKAEVREGKNNKHQIKGTGSLSINGITQTVSLELLAEVHPDRSLTLTGTKNLTFTHFLMQPPSFMGGVMQAGNDITVEIALTFSPAAPQQIVGQ